MGVGEVCRGNGNELDAAALAAAGQVCSCSAAETMIDEVGSSMKLPGVVPRWLRLGSGLSSSTTWLLARCSFAIKILGEFEMLFQISLCCSFFSKPVIIQCDLGSFILALTGS